MIKIKAKMAELKTSWVDGVRVFAPSGKTMTLTITNNSVEACLYEAKKFSNWVVTSYEVVS